MRKHLPEVILGLLFLLIFTPVARAAEAEWQIKWNEDGSLREIITVTGPPIEYHDSAWQETQDDKKQVFSRTVTDWQAYNQMPDKLPIKVNQNNYLFCTVSKIKPDATLAQESLYKNLSGVQSLQVRIEVPGSIRASSADQIIDHTAVWRIKNPGTPLGSAFTLKTVTFDGWLLGISILSLGVIIMFIFFAVRMRKVNQIIADTYSLDNIVIEEDEIGIPRIEAVKIEEDESKGDQVQEEKADLSSQDQA
ncbi:Uncharacterized [Syntrophomonas zehnderi OL-4]|uniref:Uncharacterized n=1 Tax=Syntrophomonas zehnderi OL-4 TaxID=690567 RepID=A0A0E4C8D8_9FIRM|nr:hypothetical protein [Syntrophomonas zehnderi]CFX37443.1 Uncharacterized [Syntrophomonas zehnderi OL-4]